MKNILAQAIEKGSAHLSLPDFFKDLKRDIFNDEGLYGLIEDLIADEAIDDVEIEDTEPDGVIEVKENDAAMVTEEDSIVEDSKADGITEDEDTDAVIEMQTYDYLSAHTVFCCNFYFNIIYMLATRHDTKEIVYLFMNQDLLLLEEKMIRFHIKRVKSKYRKNVELLTAIFDAKANDFVKLGATREMAMDCLNDWIRYELA
jgi:hypothetical protein